MKTIKVKVINNSKNPLPEPATPGAAGLDLRADIDAPVTIQPGERKLIPSGLHIQLPEGYELQVRPRSGLALKHGITLTNAPGTVDSDYRGDVGAVLHNLGNEPFTINPGERMCQVVAKEYVDIEWEPTDQLDGTLRGEGGYNSTGVK
jgi:dUTP pyrophosphatase